MNNDGTRLFIVYNTTNFSHKKICQITLTTPYQIDVDKIDYIQRDSFHVGIPNSGEFSRLITGARVRQIQRKSTTSTTELCWNDTQCTHREATHVITLRGMML